MAYTNYTSNDNRSREKRNTRNSSTSRVRSKYSDQDMTDESNVDSLDSLTLEGTTSNKTINTTFGKADDYVEFHLYNDNRNLIFSDENFEDYFLSKEGDSIEVDHIRVVSNLGYASGKFISKINVFKNKIFNTDKLYLSIREISSDRREIKAIAPDITNQILSPAVSTFISDLESTAYFKEFALNFGKDIIIPAINVLYNKDSAKHEILFKTLNPLPLAITTRTNFKIVEEITDPIIINTDLGNPIIIDDTIPIAGPNFNIDIRQNNSITSEFKTRDQILNYNVTSSYQELLSKLTDDSVDLNIQYDYIRPISSSLEESERSYHFENFCHFSNATERLKSFQYKLKLIESYDKNIKQINSITGPTSASNAVLLNKNSIEEKKEKIIKNLDGYEQFLYFTSGTYAWPKQNTEKPYLLYSITSSEAKTWFGNEDSNFDFFGGQLLSASLFDRQNEYSLTRLVPQHILENQNNNVYSKFVNMIGQHFDHIWIYIKSLSNIYDADNKLNKGISKDIVFHQLKSLGIEAFDQFENAPLTEYMLGIGSGSNNYNVGFNYGVGHYASSSNTPSETLITASNNSIPKGDIAKEIWKRLYHNAPYLLKTKGTERGLKALMNCYGIPPSILNVKEYGGSTVTTGTFKDNNQSILDTYKTFTYEKSSLALQSAGEGTNDFMIKANWSSSLTDALSSSAKTIEFRIKPTYVSSTDFHIFNLKAANTAKSLHINIDPYVGNDVSESNDANNYARLRLIQGETQTSLVNTHYFPLFNGDFWNIHIGTLGTSGSAANIQFGAYQANFLKNITHIVTQSILSEADRALTFGDPYYNSGEFIGGAPEVYFGGAPSTGGGSSSTGLKYKGHLQEVRYHFGELLSHTTLKKHALEPFMYSGNTLSSSFSNVVFRLPLGSNDMENSSSFHPKVDINYIDPNSISSSLTYGSTGLKRWNEINETHYLPTSDTVGISQTSEKVRIDTQGTVDENLLSPFVKSETSVLDRQPQDFEDLGIFFSPTTELNEDIIYTLGNFRMDDYIGSPLPSAQTTSNYEDLKDIKDIYFQKVKRRYNYWDYLKQIQYVDHTLFKLIEQFVPARANTKTGILIEPHLLERNKFQRNLPVRSDAQTMTEGLHQTFEGELSKKVVTIKSSSAKDFGQGAVNQNIDNAVAQFDPGSYVVHHNNFDRNKFATSSKGRRNEQGTNTTIYVYDDYLDPINKDPNAENNQFCQAPIKPFDSKVGKPTNYIAHESSVILGNMMGGRKSRKYYKYKEYSLTTSSLYT